MMTSANSLRRYYNTYHPPANSVLTFSTSSASAGSYTRGLATFLEARVPSKTPSRVGEATIFIVRADRRPHYHPGHTKMHMRIGLRELSHSLAAGEYEWEGLRNYSL